MSILQRSPKMIFPLSDCSENHSLHHGGHRQDPGEQAEPASNDFDPPTEVANHGRSTSMLIIQELNQNCQKRKAFVQFSINIIPKYITNYMNSK